MSLSSIGRRLLESMAVVSFLVITSPSGFAQAGCSSSKDVFLNPFNKNSAHHRPIGTGAAYASSSHAATRDWLKADSFNINVGGPWGVDVASSSSSDPYTKVEARAVGSDKAYGLPVTIRLPKSGLDTRVGYNTSGNTDGVAVVYDRSSGEAHQLRQFNWNNGKPTAGQYRNWDIKGLGHGTKSGQRIGTSASGVAAMFGILRGHEINAAGGQIEHALQMGLPAKAGCAVMLSKDIQLPATSRDGFASSPQHNTGNIPYGALMALPRNVDIGKLGLSEPGRRLAEGIRNYGIYVVDDGGCSSGAMRADQYIDSGVLNQLKRDIPKIYPHIRMVLNNDVLGNAVAGGGTALAPNCAFDGKAASVSTPQSSSKGSTKQASDKNVSTPSSSSGASSGSAAPSTGSSSGMLTWSATARAKDYYLEIREANSKQKKVYGRMVKPQAAGCSSGRGTCSIGIPSLRAGVDYKWKVRAVVNGKPQAYTAWAPVDAKKRSSAANDDRPSSKQVAYAVDSSSKSATSSSKTNSNGRELEWRATSGASHYYVEVREATSKQPKVYGRVVKPAAGGCTSGGTCSHELPRLPAGVDYKWKVRAVVDGDPQPYTKWASLG